MNASSLLMVIRSRTFGMLCSVTCSSVSKAAAIAGSAEFFAPLISTVPRSAFPPLIKNLSIHAFFFPCRGAAPVQTLVTRPAPFSNPPPPHAISSSPPWFPLSTSASPAPLACCVPPPAKRVPPPTHSCRSPPPGSEEPAPQPCHLSGLHQSSTSH